MVRSLKPDFAILDLHMPKLNGLQVIRKLRESGSQTKFIILSVSRDASTIREALRAGAEGYLLALRAAKRLIEPEHAGA